MTDIDHLTQIVNDRLRQIRRLEREIESWREVAGQLAIAVEHAGRPYHPSAWHTDHRCAALEAYARLKTSTLHAPDSTLSYEL
jgi:hypothetical protein